MIELNSFTCSFDETILRNVNLQIREHLTILGANGSGKSTLAKAICNLVKYSGEIKIDSKNVKDFSLKELATTISYVPSKLDSYDDHITVFDFILLSRFAHKQPFSNYSKVDCEIVEEAINSLQLSHLSSQTVSSLSSGESALVLIASALCSKSGIIIFDEPTANLDPKNSQIIASHIKKLKESHQILLITHDLNLAHFICSPVAFIKNRELQYFENEFFQDENLQNLYGVKFNSLAVVYG